MGTWRRRIRRAEYWSSEQLEDYGSTTSSVAATNDLTPCGDVQEQRGRDLNHLFERIEDSSIAIALFSPRYAESKLCLDELVKMKTLADKEKLIVIPIFYKVEAEEVSNLLSLRWLMQDMYGGNLELKKKGPLSIAVPGEVAGLFTAWKQLGKLPWKQLVYPAEKLAAEGYMISKYLYMQMNATRDDILGDKGGLSELFASKGELKKPGTIVRNPKLAFTLKQIAEHGPKVFYNGTVGVNLVKDIKKLGGIVTLKDLHGYKVKVKKPLSNDILGYRLLGMPPPSSGGPSMVLVLNILSQYEIPSGVAGPLGVHRLAEALKHAFAVRMNLGDPDFVDVTKVVSDMLSPKFAQELKKKINDEKTFDPKYYGGKWNQIHDHGTSHFSK